MRALVALCLVIGGATLAAAVPAQARTYTRCCFVLDVSVGSYVAAEYPCTTAGACGSGPSLYPTGGHFYSVQWGGREIVSYHETAAGRAQLGELFAGGGARITASATDSGDFTFSSDPNDSKRCAVVKSTGRSVNDSGVWMKTSSLLEFVPPNDTLQVDAGPSIDGIFGTTCGLGFDHHGETASASAWGGLNEPWTWDIGRAFSRAEWRTKALLVYRASKSLPPDVLQSNGPGNAASFCWDHGVRSQLFLTLAYFPARDLAAQAKEMQQLYPITGTGFHTVQNDESSGESAQAPAIGC